MLTHRTVDDLAQPTASQSRTASLSLVSTVVPARQPQGADARFRKAPG